MERRKLFDSFIKRRPGLAKSASIPKLIEAFAAEIKWKPQDNTDKEVISSSSAYRIALRRGLRGFRKNNSKYSDFWEKLNWNLPDSDLSEIWGIDRGNVQSRRRTLRRLFEQGESELPVTERPLWNKAEDAEDSQYKLAIDVEKHRARKDKSSRPV